MHYRNQRLMFSLFVLLTIFTTNWLGAQATPASEIFFLDLGIAIEPSSGSESYSRTIDKPSEDIFLLLDENKHSEISLLLETLILLLFMYAPEFFSA